MKLVSWSNFLWHYNVRQFFSYSQLLSTGLWLMQKKTLVRTDRKVRIEKITPVALSKSNSPMWKILKLTFKKLNADFPESIFKGSEMHEEQRIIDAQKSQHSDASLTVVTETKNNLHFIDDERPKYRQLNDPINILNFFSFLGFDTS